MPAISPRYKVPKAQRSAAMSGLRERLEQLKAERDILRNRKKKVTPTLRAIEGLEEELEHYEKMDWRQLDEHEAKPRGEKGGKPRQPREKGAIGLFVSESDDSGYESEVIEPVEASINPLSTTPSDGKDLRYTKRGRAYYVISQHGPDEGYKIYYARKASLHDIEKLDLLQLTELRPDGGTFRLAGIQGVVVAPDSDFRAFAEKCPWLQITVQYVDTADGKEDENKKKNAQPSSVVVCWPKDIQTVTAS
ncbi:uncharacterized protein BBA_00086 [Beauveria bassiana ARSEF 2860]|uniref:Uncharacterized protein n=1 Tax=Beauveria bassiana (strain ARSEF 2860) TaxID=655819 RepID=J5K8L4_BEAB2|nr:uncharacterized protein BBA_00086 [Beauveria bassiana ARSEF 2860]EJP70456.1 hypothetical protein BBA_00086 [Beauveria bassiana ARSEF 2860]